MRSRSGFTRAEVWAAAVAAVLALVLVPLALLGFRPAAQALLVAAGTGALTVAACAVARLTGSRAAVLALCAACALAALAVLLAFPPFEIVEGGVRPEAWPSLARGVAYGPAVAAAVADSRLEPRPRRRRRTSPPGAPY